MEYILSTKRFIVHFSKQVKKIDHCSNFYGMMGPYSTKKDYSF